MSPKEQLITWLNSAYSTEKSMIQVLENHAKDAHDHPELAQRCAQHIEETRHQAERLEQCLQILGQKPSTMKSAMGNVMGKVQGASTGMFRDELMKNLLADFAAEQFEIACYRSLIVAAEELGEPEIARLCRENLREEEEMARFLDEHIPFMTRLTLEQLTHA